MKYDDLLNVPYKHGGRDVNGLDCYGLVVECCRRNGQTLRDPARDLERLDDSLVEEYIAERGINVRKIDGARVGCIVESVFKNKAHVGFLVERNRVIHATSDKGVRTTALGALRIKNFYEVTEHEGDDLQNAIE